LESSSARLSSLCVAFRFSLPDPGSTSVTGICAAPFSLDCSL
jgi:hypothetical protein